MFVRIKGSPTTTRKYLQICKATYNQGRTSHKVVGSLGAIDDLVSSGEVKKLMLSLNQFFLLEVVAEEAEVEAAPRKSRAKTKSSWKSLPIFSLVCEVSLILKPSELNGQTTPKSL